MVCVPTGSNPYYYLNVGNSGLVVRNATNSIARFAIDGTFRTYYNIKIGGSILGNGLTQINNVVMNDITAVQTNASVSNLNDLFTCTLPNFISAGSSLSHTNSAVQSTI